MPTVTRDASALQNAICLIVLLFAALPMQAVAQQPDQEKTKKQHAELDKAAQERMSQARRNLQAFFDARKIIVRWGVESRQTRILPSGTALGKATLRFDYVWAEGAEDGGKERIGYWKSGAAEFELIGKNWQLAEVIWRTPIPDSLSRSAKTLVQEIDILKLLVAEKGAGYWLKEGMANSKAGKWEQASADLTKALDLEPLALSAWNERGIVRLRMGQASHAVADFSKAIDLAPKNQIILINRGDAYSKLGQWEKAVLDSSKAIELNGEYDQAWMLRGTAHASLAQWAKAAEDFAKAATFPKTAQRATGYGALVQLQLKSPKGYREACARLLDKWEKGEDPKEAAFIAWTCSAVPDSGAKLARIIEVLKKQESKDYTSVRNLGAALHRSGKSQQAIEALLKAVESRKQPSASAWIFLAMAHHELGQKDEAGQCLQKATNQMAEIRKMDTEINPSDGLSLKRASWHERLTLELIFREAEQLLKNPDKR